VWVDIDQILANPRQPREHFHDEGLGELARSIQSHGVLQPVVVRRAGSGYQLIAGERRWRAAQRAGLVKMPAIVRDAAEDRVLEMALIENLQRQDLNPVEEARAFWSLVDELGLTQEEISQRVGKPRASISNSLRILKLPESVQNLVRRGVLSAGHAKVLSGLSSAQEQTELAREVQKRGLSVRDLERLLTRRGRAAGRASRKSRPRTDPNTTKAEDDLKRALATQVRIERRGKGGSVVIEFYDEEELHRLYSLFMDAAQ
jgi:ParB family chromosome partitioning protein